MIKHLLAKWVVDRDNHWSLEAENHYRHGRIDRALHCIWLCNAKFPLIETAAEMGIELPQYVQAQHRHWASNG